MSKSTTCEIPNQSAQRTAATMKNRFYYSEKQVSLDPDHHCYVFNGTEYVEYSEWCSHLGYTSNWDDAKLVYATDEEPVIKVEGGSVYLDFQLPKYFTEEN